ncbi:hypothetical protein PHET_00159 [Paragonimus heterotremus]|uniref:Uncharacterized protein n=1 Tax=Paragonimus heterotremus TaxID=100268 RepID=A0A8J4WMD0_9TREM|nr:hypothetical protein PHET_00159 [Paragonimus heterotremus]
MLYSGLAQKDVSVSSKHESRSNLGRIESGKQRPLMKQSGQIISCTTLFSTKDTEGRDHFSDSVASKEWGNSVEALLNRTVEVDGPVRQKVTTSQTGSGSDRQSDDSTKRDPKGINAPPTKSADCDQPHN